jgi:hypothetical protein
MNMLHALSVWLVAATFVGAGLFNAIGTSATRSNFVRWGYPAWWCRVTAGLELATAVLTALPVTREAGLLLGAAIIAAAALTVLRHREFAHLAPVGPFIALLALAGLTS